MPKTLGIWEWGCPKRGDAHITKTAAYLYSQAIYTGRPGFDFVSQSTDINLPHLWPASGRPSGLALGPASFDSARLIEFFLKTTFFFTFTRSDLTLNISFIELKSKRLLERLIKQCEKGWGIQYFDRPRPVFIRFTRMGSWVYILGRNMNIQNVNYCKIM